MDLTAIRKVPHRASLLLAALLAVVPPVRAADPSHTRPSSAQPPPAATAAPGTPASTPLTAPAAAKPEPTTEANVHLPSVEEIKLGREGAVEVEKEYKLVQDPVQLARLKTIGDELLRAANDPELIREYREAYKVPKKGDKSKRVPFQFTFKIVKS